MIPALCPSMAPVNATKMIDLLAQLGLTSGLQLCLDASDSASYSGSGQTWGDRSGGGYDFFRGTTSSSEASDPTFNGTAGNQSSSEYFSLDGGDWFTLGQANPAWVQQMHKANAKQTLLAWTYVNNVTSTSQPFASIGDTATGSNTSTGLNFGGNGGATLRDIFAYVGNGASQVYLKESSAAAVNNAWNCLAVSMDMAAGNVIFNVNSAQETYSGQSYSSPSAGNAASTLQIGATGSGEFPDVTGTRWAAIAIWNVALTAAQLASIFAATRAKFGV